MKMPQALRPDDYTDGPIEMQRVFPFKGGTLDQQRAVLAERAERWAVENADATAAREAEHRDEQNRRAEAWPIGRIRSVVKEA